MKKLKKPTTFLQVIWLLVLTGGSTVLLAELMKLVDGIEGNALKDDTWAMHIGLGFGIVMAVSETGWFAWVCCQIEQVAKGVTIEKDEKGDLVIKGHGVVQGFVNDVLACHPTLVAKPDHGGALERVRGQVMQLGRLAGFLSGRLLAVGMIGTLLAMVNSFGSFSELFAGLEVEEGGKIDFNAIKTGLSGFSSAFTSTLVCMALGTLWLSTLHFVTTLLADSLVDDIDAIAEQKVLPHLMIDPLKLAMRAAEKTQVKSFLNLPNDVQDGFREFFALVEKLSEQLPDVDEAMEPMDEQEFVNPSDDGDDIPWSPSSFGGR